MKKLGSKLLMMILVVVLIAGCSGKNSSSGSTDSSGGGSNTPQESSNQGDTAREKVELTFWVAGNSEQQQKTYDQIIQNFNEQYASQGISAKVQYVPWSELQQKLTTSLAGGSGPDLFMHGAAAAAGLAAKNQLEPLDDYLAAWEDTSDYIPSYLDAGKVDGKTYVLPIEGANRMFIYRTDIFEEAGVQVPTTWEELKEISRKLLVKEGNRVVRYPTSLPTNGIDLQQSWTPYLWANGGDLFNEDFTAATLTTQEAKEALEFYKSFFDEGLVPLEGVTGQGDQHPLGTGEIAFIVDGVFILESIKNYTPDAYDKLAIAPPPAGRGEPTTLVGSAGIFMNAASKHKDEAWELLSFIGNKENAGKIAEELKYLPVRKSLVEADFVQSDPLFKRFVELSGVVNGKVNPNIAAWTTVRDILAGHIERALYGQVSVDEALANAEQEINNVLNQ